MHSSLRIPATHPTTPLTYSPAQVQGVWGMAIRVSAVGTTDTAIAAAPTVHAAAMDIAHGDAITAIRGCRSQAIATTGITNPLVRRATANAERSLLRRSL